MDSRSASKQGSGRPRSSSIGRSGHPNTAHKVTVGRVEQLVDEIIENYVNENLVLQGPPAIYVGPNPSPSSIPLPTIDTMLQHPALRHTVYETMCYGEDRVLPLAQSMSPPTQGRPALPLRVEHRAPVNRFGLREMETIKEEAESPRSPRSPRHNETSWLSI